MIARLARERGTAVFLVVAVLAVGGVEAVEAKQDTLPAATLLLKQLDPKRLLSSAPSTGR